jgi:hypothetical protein
MENDPGISGAIFLSTSARLLRRNLLIDAEMLFKRSDALKRMINLYPKAEHILDLRGCCGTVYAHGEGDPCGEHQAGVIAPFILCNGCMTGTVRVASRFNYLARTGMGHGRTTNYVCGDGSFPRKQPLRPFCTMRA